MATEPDRLLEEGDRAHERALLQIRADVRFADLVATLSAASGVGIGGATSCDPCFYRVHSPRGCADS